MNDSLGEPFIPRSERVLSHFHLFDMLLEYLFLCHPHEFPTKLTLPCLFSNFRRVELTRRGFLFTFSMHSSNEERGTTTLAVDWRRTPDRFE